MHKRSHLAAASTKDSVTLSRILAEVPTLVLPENLHDNSDRHAQPVHRRLDSDQCFRNWGPKLGSQKYRFGVQFGVHLGSILGSFSTKMPLKRAQDLAFFFFFTSHFPIYLRKWRRTSVLRAVLPKMPKNFVARCLLFYNGTAAQTALRIFAPISPRFEKLFSF
jgi:hypothetical protein